MSEKLERRQSLQTIAWFNDLYKRRLLDLDPPYQRRSVWNLAYQQFFIETVLLAYPAPAIFLYEEISAEGTANYHVVDGKQRLTALFEFAAGQFPLAEDSVISRHQGQYFSQLEESLRKSFWTYQFLVEYVPTTDLSTLNSVFDRINRNVVKLTRQELRHAKFDGLFARAADEVVALMESHLPKGVPNIMSTSRKQMKDVEFAAQLLLLAEVGVRSTSQDDLDDAYSERDADWEKEVIVRDELTRAIFYVGKIFKENQFSSLTVSTRRIRNQADFYSLVGAVLELQRESLLPEAGVASARLAAFLETVQDDQMEDPDARAYYNAARSASNDLGPRETRVRIVRDVIAGARQE